MIKLSLNAEQILNEKFSPVPRGYDPFMVDRFFDKMLEDYRVVEKNVLLSTEEYKNMLEKIAELERKISAFELENAQLKARLSNIKDSDAISKDNVDLIRRINCLEKFLYQEGFNPQTIK